MFEQLKQAHTEVLDIQIIHYFIYYQTFGWRTNSDWIFLLLKYSNYV